MIPPTQPAAREIPAAPATQPRPKMGVRLMFVGKFIRLVNRASMLGVARPVVEQKKIAEMSTGFRPARSRAVVIACRPRLSAPLIHASFVSPNPEKRP